MKLLDYFSNKRASIPAVRGCPVGVFVYHPVLKEVGVDLLKEMVAKLAKKSGLDVGGIRLIEIDVDAEGSIYRAVWKTGHRRLKEIVYRSNVDRKKTVPADIIIVHIPINIKDAVHERGVSNCTKRGTWHVALTEFTNNDWIDNEDNIRMVKSLV